MFISRWMARRWSGFPVYVIFLFMAFNIAALFVYEWLLGVISVIAATVILYYAIRAEKTFLDEADEYIGTLTHRIKRAGDEVAHDFPIGIVLYSEDKVVEWGNAYALRMLQKELLVGEPLGDLFPDLRKRKDKEKDPVFEMKLVTRTYEVKWKTEERLLYFQDITPQKELLQKYQEEKVVVGLIFMDNLDEATQGMDDQARSIMLAKVTGLINEWALGHNIYLRRTASDRYLAIMDQRALNRLEQDRFEILDDVRDATHENKVPFTLSVGIAAGVDSIIELGRLAQTSLDMALGRGGDQAAVKIGQRMSFYGGRSNAIEKHTRVRARVISHALRDLIKESDKVMIMGHRVPDTDSIGAAIGVLKAVHMMNKDGYIVLEGVNPSIEKLMVAIHKQEKFSRWFITPAQALQMTKARTLAVVVDTHKASMLAEPKILELTNRKVVVDHHRRGEEFIQDAVLMYMEPYASSTCELVTELLQYFHDRISLDPFEATLLLAGITMDTKSFSLRTGARTFDAASFLRRNGADSGVIQRLLKEDLGAFMDKADIMKHAEVLYDHIALAVTEPSQRFSQLLIAQVADTLLNMTDIMASFVISERPDGLIGISARSLGQINVQIVMERLGGGGHLTNAATQLDTTIQEAKERLKGVLSEIEAEEGLFE